MKKNYLQVKQELIKNSPEGGMGYRVPCPRCGIKQDFYVYVSKEQCAVCNPVNVSEALKAIYDQTG